jgi:hypothetical protein
VLQVTFKDFLQWLGQLLNVSDLSFVSFNFMFTLPKLLYEFSTMHTIVRLLEKIKNLFFIIKILFSCISVYNIMSLSLD